MNNKNPNKISHSVRTKEWGDSTNTSVEHQDSGLLWNIDNWVYLSYNMERYRYTDDSWRPEQQPGHWTQWGLTHDDLGGSHQFTQPRRFS